MVEKMTAKGYGEMVIRKDREEIIKKALDEIGEKLRTVTVDTERNKLLNKLNSRLNIAILKIMKREREFMIEDILYKTEEYLEKKLTKPISKKEKELFVLLKIYLENTKLSEIKKYNMTQRLDRLKKIIQLYDDADNKILIVKILRKVFDKPELKEFHFNPNDALNCPICKEPQINSLVLYNIVHLGNNREQIFKAFTGELIGFCHKNIAKSEWEFRAFVFYIIDKNNNSELKLSIVPFNLEKGV
jgi:hypothetical protein